MKITDKVGILDPEGLELNPLTGENYSSSYRYYSIEFNNGGWSNLPMYKNKEYTPLKVIKMINDNQVMIIEAGTGQGKTVIVPKYCLHAVGYTGKVVATNPKKIPTKKNAEFSAMCSDVELTKHIGYKYMGSAKDNRGKKTSSEDTNLLYATDGTLVEILRKDPACKDYDIIIIDEAHERNMRIDNILLQMKLALRLNPKLKLVVMSATLPGNLFKEYFKEFKTGFLELPAVPNKPVEIHYLEEPVKNKRNMDEASVDVLFNEIIYKEKEGDVLIFVNSLPAALKTCELIHKKIKEYNKEKIQCYGLTGKVSDPETIKLATDENYYKELPGGPWNRKIVVGTEALESSITIKGLVYVIDSGLHLESRWDPDRLENQMTSEDVAKDAIKQRSGRVGRTKPGECFRMYTKKNYEERQDFTTVEIKKSNLTGEFLEKFLEDNINTVGDVKNLLKQYIEEPPVKFVTSAVKILYQLKLIDTKEDSGVLTEKGKKVLLLNKDSGRDVSLATALSTSIDYGCHFEMCCLVAIILKTDYGRIPIIEPPIDKRKKSDYEAKKKIFTNHTGDLLSYYTMYNIFYRNVKKLTIDDLKKLCEKFYLNYRLLRTIREEHLNLWRIITPYIEYKDVNVKTYDNYTNLVFSFLSGYNIFIAKAKENNKKNYKNLFPKVKTFASIDRNSYFKKPSEYIFYLSLNCISGNRSFSVCNKITKNQIEVFSSKLGYDISLKKYENNDSRKLLSKKKTTIKKPTMKKKTK